MYDILSIWKSMNARCGRVLKYKDCTVCDEWKNDFKSFAKWFVDNLYECGGETLQIDKDLFSKGKKIYSPETCCLLPRAINMILAYERKKKSNLPTGVTKTKNGSYCALINQGGTIKSRVFKTVEEASAYWKYEKKQHITHLANYYKKYLPKYIYDALVSYKL